MADENVMIMCLVFVMAGAFSGAVNAAGGADSTVNFGLSILPSNVAVVGVFLIGCFYLYIYGYISWYNNSIITNSYWYCRKNRFPSGSLFRCGLFVVQCLVIIYL